MNKNYKFCAFLLALCAWPALALGDASDDVSRAMANQGDAMTITDANTSRTEREAMELMPPVAAAARCGSRHHLASALRERSRSMAMAKAPPPIMMMKDSPMSTPTGGYASVTSRRGPERSTNGIYACTPHRSSAISRSLR